MQDVHVCVWGSWWGCLCVGVGVNRERSDSWPTASDPDYRTWKSCWELTSPLLHVIHGWVKLQGYTDTSLAQCLEASGTKKNQCLSVYSAAMQSVWSWRWIASQNKEWNVSFVNIQALLLNNCLEFLLCLRRISSYILTYIKIPCLHIMSYIMK